MSKTKLTPAEAAIKAAFNVHKSSARKRGIPFTLSFEQWWELWAQHWHLRGSRRGCKVMCRKYDEGGYSLGNVRIDTVEANARERRLTTPTKRVASAWKPKMATAICPELDWASCFSRTLDEEE